MLADEMGLGKTPQAIYAAQLVGARKVLVVCPACARINWQREWIKFANERRTYVVTDGRFDRKQLAAARVIICSYDILVRSKKLRDLMLDLKRDVTVLDEAHYLKTPNSKRTRIIFGRRLRGDYPSIVANSKHAWCLTGTPVPNNASELYAPMKGLQKLQPTVTLASFVQTFCSGYSDAYGFKITGSKNQRAMHALWRGSFLRRRKVDVLPDMPPITWGTVFVDGTEPDLPEDVRAYMRENNMTQEQLVDWLKSQSEHLATYRRLTGMAKIDGVVEHAKGILEDTGQKLVVFAHHTDVLLGVAEGLKDYGAVKFYGGTASGARQAAVDAFQNDSACRVFVGQITAAGTAINLDAASRLLFAEQDWVPGNNAQAAMRIHRMTQKNPCLIEFATLAGSVDEDIASAVQRKTRDIIKILGDEND